jgi:hypothetical protein
MALRILSDVITKKKQPSLLITLVTAGLLIGVGSIAYWFFTEGKPFFRYLPTGANIIPENALFTVSLTTDSQQWENFQNLLPKENQRKITTNLFQLKQRFLNNNGYEFETDVKPWVGEEVTFAVLPPAFNKSQSSTKTDKPEIYEQSMLMILPIRKPKVAQKILAKNQSFKLGKITQRNYQGVIIKQIQGRNGEKFDTALINQKFMIITDHPHATERTIDAYKNQTSLANLAGFTTSFSKISRYQSLVQLYINVPIAAKIAAQTPNRNLPAQVITQLQNNQGLAATVSLKSQGISIQGISWLKPNSSRVLTVENKAGNIPNLLPSETLMILSGSNLKRLWLDYVSTSKGNPLSPLKPEELRKNIKEFTNLDLDKDLLNWMTGEFAVSVIPNTPENTQPDNFRAGLVFMIKAENDQIKKSAQNALKKLDSVAENQYQFQIKSAQLGDRSVANWISPFGTLTATHGWLNENILFFVFGAPISEKLVIEPNQTLARNAMFQKAISPDLNSAHSLFFVDMERGVKNFAFQRFSPLQKSFVSAISTIGVTTTIKDNRSQQYDIFLELKQVQQ